MTRRFPTSLLLVFHRSVGGEKISEALADSLADKLAADKLEEFSKALFDVLKDGVNAGTKLYFHCDGGKPVGIAVDQVTATATAPKEACFALLQTYYGPDPVSKEAKDGMAAGFAKLAGAVKDS